MRTHGRQSRLIVVGLMAVVLVLATTSCGTGPAAYPVLIADIGQDQDLADLAWVAPDTLYFLTSSIGSSDSPASLWVSAGGQRRLLYSFSESSLRWDSSCDRPYFIAMATKDAAGAVAVVDCAPPSGSDRRLVTITGDGSVTSLGPAHLAYDVAWRRGTDGGAVVVGPSTCSTLTPVRDRALSAWTAPMPPWNLNEQDNQATCAFRGMISRVEVQAGDRVAFVAKSRDGSVALYDLDPSGGEVQELAGGFDSVQDMAVTGSDIVLSASREGRTGLWRWARATGKVVSVAEGSFTRIAASPDGSALAAGRNIGEKAEVVRVALP